MHPRLRELADSLTSPVTRRLLVEYGAVFVTRATPPPTVLFAGARDVGEFQSSLPTKGARFGEYDVELQASALESLVQAAQEAQRRGLTLSARAADSGRRSYEETVALWSRNVGRGLTHWSELGRLDSGRAAAIQALPPVEQVPVILELEAREAIYFGTFFNRSILYSVAAPGASQHLSMLAFDVAEYKEEGVEQALNACGWFRTVVHDLPHFTYLGCTAEELPASGLRQVEQRYDDFCCRYWVPLI